MTFKEFIQKTVYEKLLSQYIYFSETDSYERIVEVLGDLDSYPFVLLVKTEKRDSYIIDDKTILTDRFIGTGFVELKENRDIHTGHCCIIHGCKYLDDEGCTVVTGKKKQSYQCGYCYNDY